MLIPKKNNSNFTGNLVGNLVSNRVGETAIYFIIEEVKETVLSFLKGEPLFFFFFFGDSNYETNFTLKLLLTYTPI